MIKMNKELYQKVKIYEAYNTGLEEERNKPGESFHLEGMHRLTSFLKALNRGENYIALTEVSEKRVRFSIFIKKESKSPVFTGQYDRIGIEMHKYSADYVTKPFLVMGYANIKGVIKLTLYNG